MKTQILILFIALFLVLPLVNALDFSADNYKVYDNKTQTVQIFDTGQLGEDTLLINAKLETPTSYYVIQGKDRKVAEITIQGFTGDYDSLEKTISQIEFYDLRNNNKRITREFTYKVKTIYYENITTTKKVCSNPEDNYIVDSKCEVENIVTSVEKESWSNLGETKLDKEVTIGIFTEVYANDNIEWIPNIAGKDVNEWANWIASYNVNLASYLKLDEGSGVIANNSVTNGLSNNGTLLNGGTLAVNGKINGGYNTTAHGRYITVTGNQTQVAYQTNLSYTLWLKTEEATCSNNYDTIISAGSATNLILDFVGATCQLRTFFVGGGGQTLTGVNVTPNVWSFIAITHTAGGQTKVYLNGSLILTDTGNSWGDAATVTFAGNPYSAENFYGLMDEIGIWNRTLTGTEVSDMYNNYDGMSYTSNFNFLTATQSYPATEYNTTSSSTNFGCNFTSTNQNISSAKIVVEDVLGGTPYTDTVNYADGVTNIQQEWTVGPFANGKFNWACYAYGNQGVNGSTTNRTYTIDNINPTINIITPSGNQGIQTIPYSVILNYTASDTHLQTCRYNSTISPTLVTQTCNQTAQINSTAGTHYVYVYANDSFGNSNVSVSSWYPGATYSNVTYNNITTEGAIENFKVYFVSYSLPTINRLVYNGTVYNGNIVSLGSNNYLLNNSITIPLVTLQQNMTFYWNVTFNDSSNLITTNFNQTVNNFGVDNCTGNSVLLFNFSLYDEDSKAFLNGPLENTSVKVDLNFYNYGTTTLLLNYSNSIPYTNPVQICLASQINSTRYSLDGIVQYSSTNRFPEFYNIQRYTVDNSSYNANIPLYDLNTSTGTEFKITYKDANFIPVADALVYIQRRYIEDGLFRTVEIPKTGADGTALGKFVRNNAIYNIVFVKNGVTLATFSNIIPVCQNPTVYNCEINLNSLGSGTIPQDYSNIDGISFTLSYNKTTRTVSSTYSITSGVPETVSLNLTVNDALGTTIISSDSLLSAGGTLSASVPEVFGNGSITAKLYKSNQVVGNAMIKVYEDPEDIYGASWLFIALFCIIFLVGMAVTDNPMVYGVSLVLGVAMLIMMNIVYSPSIIGVGATILYLVVAIIIIMMKGSERN